MKREQRSEDTLRKASDALYYEVWMLLTVAHGQSTGIAGESVINNALLESFVIHARALLDFLYAEKPRSNDIIAEDFLPDPEEWAKIRNPETALLKTVHKRVGKEAAHLTYARLDITWEAKQWAVSQIAEDILLVFNQFLELLPISLLGTRWENQKKEWVKADQKENA